MELTPYSQNVGVHGSRASVGGQVLYSESRNFVMFSR